MRTKVLVLLAVACNLSSAWPAAAQEQAGSIAGVVRDWSDAVLPGAMVKARGPQMAGVGKAVANSEGVYRFPSLPAGTYSVTATLRGFSPRTVENVVLQLGQLLEVDLTLLVGGVSESVVVTGRPPILDTRQTASFTTIEEDVIGRVPKGRDFTSLVKMAPGIEDETMSGGIQVEGASGAENRFVIDGMDTTDLLLGTSGKEMLVDFVAQVQVKSSGYNAEFGGATGGVISAVTKSGSNSVRGSVGLHYQDNRFYGGRSPASRYWPWDQETPERGLFYPNTPSTYLSPTADLGGPILKDKLWYYVGYGLTSNSYERDAIFHLDPSKSNRHFEWWNRSQVLNYNVTSPVTNNIRVKLGGSNQRSGGQNAAPTLEPQNSTLPDGRSTQGYTLTSLPKNPDGTIDQAAYDWRWNKRSATRDTSDTWSANLDWVIRSQLFANLFAGYFRTNAWTPPESRSNQVRHSFSSSNTGIAGIPQQFKQPAYYDDIPSVYATLKDVYSRFNLSANATWFKSWAGLHTFKAGAAFEQLRNDSFSGDTNPEIAFYWNRTWWTSDGRRVRGKYGYYSVSQSGYIGDVRSNDGALWLQDSWTIRNRLTINAGVRAENEHIPTYKPDGAEINFGFREKTAPRLGFAYDIKADGRWKLYGSYGWFFDATKLEAAKELFGGYHWMYYYWTLDTYDWPSINCGEGTTGCPGTFIEQENVRPSTNTVDPILEAYFNRPGMTGVDPNLRPMKTGEFTLGADHELNTTMSVGVRYAHKWLTRAIEDVAVFIPGAGGDDYEAPGTVDYVLGNPGFGYTEVLNPSYPEFKTPHAVRNYDSLELRFKKRFGNRWSLDASYLYSRLWGNYGGLASSDEDGRVTPNLELYFDSPYLLYDSNNQVVIGLLPTDRPHRLKVQATYDFPWGTSVGAFGLVQSGTPQTSQVDWNGYPVYLNGRGDLGRSPVFSQVDLQLSHSFRFGGNRQLTLLANADNLFDQKTVLSYYTNLYRDSFRQGDEVFYGGPWNASELAAEMKAEDPWWQDEAFFGEPKRYQSRRAVRVQVRFSF